MARGVSTNPALLVHKPPLAFTLGVTTRQNWQIQTNSVELLTYHEVPFSGNRRLMQSQQDEIMQSALQGLLNDYKQSDYQCGLTQEFVRGLLIKSDFEREVCNTKRDDLLHQKLRGLPERPFYQEITRRLQIICDHKKICDSDSRVNQLEGVNVPFLPAKHFGMTEIESMDTLIPHPPAGLSIEHYISWLRQAGERGILALLGMRQTIGTASLPFGNDRSCQTYLMPPSSHDLIEASCQLHKPNSKSSMTVGARALTKHADRGQSRFYGTVQGNESVKNDHAESVIKKLIQDASWINIHNFGGTDASQPVIEVRTMEGYGARWSAVWKDAFTPEQIAFRGFVEPQMEDGHEKRWRH